MQIIKNLIICGLVVLNSFVYGQSFTNSTSWTNNPSVTKTATEGYVNRSVSNAVYSINTNYSPRITSLENRTNVWNDKQELIYTPASSFTYTTNNNQITITSFIGNETIVYIPPFINNYPVRIIGNGAFSHNGTITDFYMPHTLRIIDNGAFDDFHATNTVLNEGLQIIKSNAFSRSWGLYSLTIPKTVIEIQDLAFDDWRHVIHSVYFEGDAPVVAENIFHIATNTVYYLTGNTGFGKSFAARPTHVYGSKITANIITDGVTNSPDIYGNTSISIYNSFYSPYYDFLYYISNNTVIITNYIGSASIVSIPPKIENLPVVYVTGFNNSNISSLIFPNGVIKVGDFGYSTNLVSILFSDTITDFSEAIFEKCAIKTLTLPNSEIYWGSKSAWFNDCYSLTNITIPNKVKTLPSSIFFNCTNLLTVSIGSGITSIGNRAFNKCYNLKGSYFSGDSPTLLLYQSSIYPFETCTNSTMYYLSGMTNFGTVFGKRPTAIYGPRVVANLVINSITNSPDIYGNITLTNIASTSITNGLASTNFVNTSIVNATNTLASTNYVNSMINAIPASDSTRIINISSNIFVSISASNLVMYGISYEQDLNNLKVTFNNIRTSPGNLSQPWDNVFVTPNSSTPIYSGSWELQTGVGPYQYSYLFYPGNMWICNDSSVAPFTMVPEGGSNTGDVYVDYNQIASTNALKTFTSFEDMTNYLNIYIPRIEALENRTNIWNKAWQNPISSTNWLWSSDGRYITLTNYSGPSDVIIPDVLDGLPVTGFGTIFAGNSTITSISLGANINTISPAAFTDCIALSGNITFGNNILSIGDAAFSGCTNLIGVISFGDNITSIGESAFDNCPLTGTENLIFPKNLTTLGRFAFNACKGLHNVSFSKELSFIGDYAFYFCSNLTNINCSGNAPVAGGDYILQLTSINLKVNILNPTAYNWSINYPTSGIHTRPVVCMALYGDGSNITGLTNNVSLTNFVDMSIVNHSSATNPHTQYLRNNATNGIMWFSPLSSQVLSDIGMMGWDATWHTPSVKLNNHVTGQLFQEDLVYVTNITSTVINDGRAVYLYGSSGGYDNVYLASSTNLDCTTKTLGIATETISNSCAGYITVRGNVNNINTSPFATGSTLYLTTTPGAYTNALPSFPENVITMGTVSISDSVTGRIVVRPVYIPRIQENIIGTYYGYGSITNIPGYSLLTNNFSSNGGYYTRTVLNATNNQSLMRFNSGISRITQLPGNQDITVSLYAEKLENAAMGINVSIRATDTNYNTIASLSTMYTELSTFAEPHVLKFPNPTNLIFSVPIFIIMEISASHVVGDQRDYAIYAEDGRPLTLSVPLSSGQFVFKSDLDALIGTRGATNVVTVDGITGSFDLNSRTITLPTGTIAYQNSNSVNVVTGNFQKINLEVGNNNIIPPAIIPSIYRNLIQSSNIVTVNQDRVIYTVELGAGANSISNDISGLDISGREASWEVWVNFTATNGLNVNWAANTVWEGLNSITPELVITGQYKFAFSTVDGITITGRQLNIIKQQPYLQSYFGANVIFSDVGRKILGTPVATNIVTAGYFYDAPLVGINFFKIRTNITGLSATNLNARFALNTYSSTGVYISTIWISDNINRLETGLSSTHTFYATVPAGVVGFVVCRVAEATGRGEAANTSLSFVDMYFWRP